MSCSSTQHTDAVGVEIAVSGNRHLTHMTNIEECDTAIEISILGPQFMNSTEIESINAE